MTALPDAPVTAVDYEADEARPLQDLPRTRLWAYRDIPVTRPAALTT